MQIPTSWPRLPTGCGIRLPIRHFWKVGKISWKSSNCWVMRISIQRLSTPKPTCLRGRERLTRSSRSCDRLASSAGSRTSAHLMRWCLNAYSGDTYRIRAENARLQAFSMFLCQFRPYAPDMACVSERSTSLQSAL